MTLLSELWEAGKRDGLQGHPPEPMTNFASMAAARAYGAAYSKAIALTGKKLLGDEKWWVRPKREWAEGTYWQGGAEAFSRGRSPSGGGGIYSPYPHAGVGSWASPMGGPMPGPLPTAGY